MAVVLAPIGLGGQAIVESEHPAQRAEHVSRLEQLDRQKTGFPPTASHELRIPLTSISGYLELLRDGRAGTTVPVHLPLAPEQ